MNTPTPETDKRIGIISNGSNVVDASWARQLERERDQLRKVCDDLAKCLKNPAIFQRMESIDAMCNYNSLPHVIAAKKGNEV